MKRIPQIAFYGAVALLAEMAVFGAIVAMPIFALKQLEASALDLGLLGMANGGAYALAALAAGRQVDRHPRHRAYYLPASVVMLLSSVVLPWAPSIWVLLLISTVQMIALGYFWTPLMTELSEVTPPSDLSRTLNRYNAAWCVGSIAGSYGAGLLYDRAGPAWPFYGAAVAMIFVVGLIIAVRPRTATAPPPPPEPRRIVAVSFKRCAWITLLANFFVLSLVIYMFPKLVESGPLALSPERIGQLHALRHVIMLATFIIMSLTAHWHFRNYPFVLIFTLLVGMMVFMGMVRTPGWFVVPFALFGVCIGLGFGLSLYYSMLDPDARASKVGIHEALLSLGLTLGPIFGGALVQVYDEPIVPFWVALGPLLALAAWAVWVARLKPSHGPRHEDALGLDVPTDAPPH